MARVTKGRASLQPATGGVVMVSTDNERSILSGVRNAGETTNGEPDEWTGLGREHNQTYCSEIVGDSLSRVSLAIGASLSESEGEDWS